MDKKFILNVPPTGMIPTKEITPKVPVHPEEIVKQVNEVADLGANMVHIHARAAENGKPSHQKEIYSEIISGIR